MRAFQSFADAPVSAFVPEGLPLRDTGKMIRIIADTVRVMPSGAMRLLPLAVALALLGQAGGMAQPEPMGPVGITATIGDLSLDSRALTPAPIMDAFALNGPRELAALTSLEAGMQDGRTETRTPIASVSVPIVLLPDDAIHFGFGTLHGPHTVALNAMAGLFHVRTATLAPVAAEEIRVQAAAHSERELAPETARAPEALATPAALEFHDAQTFSSVAAPRDLAPAVAIATAAAGLGLGLLTLLGAALYSRIRSHRALDNDTRKCIFHAVCENPGLGVQQLARVAGVAYSTTAYHLDRLVDARMLVMTPAGNTLRYYKNGGTFSEQERRILPLLQNRETARLLEAIANAPGIYRSQLALQLDVTSTTINWHLRRLMTADLVREERTGRSAHLYTQETAATLLAQLAEKLESSACETAACARRLAAASGA